MINKISRNVHELHYNKDATILLVSDLHWDNPKCDRKLLKNHLDEAVRRDAKIVVNGDFFCLMQGKYDPRRSKNDILPEHNKPNYIDAVIEDAVNWFAPYKDHLVLLGYGNHETAIIKNCETDPLQRFADLFNSKHKANVQVGGYGGVLALKMVASGKSSRSSFVIRYHHGHGGGGVVTKGVIQDQRLMSYLQSYDMTWMGHVHELYHHINPIEHYDRINKEIKIKNVHQLRTSSYKEEYDGGFGGFHIERGRAPKPLGGYWLNLHLQTYPKIEIITDLQHCTNYYGKNNG